MMRRFMIGVVAVGGLVAALAGAGRGSGQERDPDVVGRVGGSRIGFSWGRER